MISFTAEAYAGLIAQYNAAIWPAQVVALALGLIALSLALRADAPAARVVPWVLAAAWLWTGLAFHGLWLAALVWAAWGFAALFVLQGVLLALAGLRGRLRFATAHGPARWAGLGLAVLAPGLHPIAGLLGGGDWTSLRPFILAPAPLTLFTFALVLLAAPRAPRHLLIVPILWSMIAGAVAWELGRTADLVLPLAAAATLGLSLRAPR